MGNSEVSYTEFIGVVISALSGVAVIALALVASVPALAAYVVPGLMVVSTYAFVVFQMPPWPGPVPSFA